jgi:microcystin-dependent protein
MSNAFTGQITMFGGNFAPRGFAFCNGQLMPISQNPALFSLIGTIYGGDGKTTFALPNLQSRLPMHQGQGPGLTNRQIGQASGTNEVTLQVNAMPAHDHALNATTATATDNTIAGNLLPGQPTVGNPPAFYAIEDPNSPLNRFKLAGNSGSAGGSQPHTNKMPSLCISFVICLSGIFPSKN